MIRDITMAIWIDFCGFFASSPANKVEHNDIVTNLIFIQICRVWHVNMCKTNVQCIITPLKWRKQLMI
jgi:hypothetical protein